jgi:hypothetical protein
MNFEKQFSGAFNHLYLWRMLRLMVMGWIVSIIILVASKFSWIGILGILPLVISYLHSKKVGKIFITHLIINNDVVFIEWRDGNQTKTLNKPVSKCSVNIQSANLYKSKRQMMKLKTDEIEIRQYEILGWRKLDFDKIKTKIDSINTTSF